MLRPETGAYLANQAAARRLFQHAMHDRLGEPNLAERLRRDDTLGSAWVRIAHHEADHDMLDEQLEVDSALSLLQVGTDLLRWGERGRGQLGAMLAAGKNHNRTTSVDTGFAAKGKVEGTALGVYGTWFADPTEVTGLYVDTWLQYARYKHRVNGEGLPEERYDTHTWEASAEAGYAWQVFAGADTAVFVEPQWQVAYAGYRSDTHVEANGTVVQTTDAGGWSTRVGVRLFGRGTHAQEKWVQPFVTANWLHDDGDNAMAFDGEQLIGGAPGDRYELKVGVQAEFGEGWTGWGQLGAQDGEDDYRDVGGQIGLKRSW